MHTKPQDFPFGSVLSLEPLIQFWKKLLAEGSSAKASFAKTIQEELEKAPELSGPIEDLSVLDRHRELLDLLLSVVFPAATRDRDLRVAQLWIVA